MEKGLVDLEKLRKLKNKCDFRGKSAYCFLKDNKIIKIYASGKDKGFIPIDRNSIFDFSNYVADTIVFPDEYIYEKNTKAGEILKYFDEKTITLAFKDDTDIKKLLDNYELVLNDIMTYSNILMCDLCSVNILYSEKAGFHIIDTTEWEINKFDNSIDNIGRLSAYLIKVILEYVDLTTCNYYNYPYLDKRIKEFTNRFGKTGENFYKVLFNSFNERYNFLKFIYAYQDLYRKYYTEELKSLNDMKELTKVIKKG